ncbi:MAG: hypothetical protein KBF88_10960 [Polyangiaceae bacterium]|nr:hypothetical protein [Polyangiaceae bacterium]
MTELKRLIDSGNVGERELLGSLRASSLEDEAKAKARVAIALGLSAAAVTKTASAAVVASSSAASGAKVLTGGVLPKALAAGGVFGAKATLATVAVVIAATTSGTLLVLREPSRSPTHQVQKVVPSLKTPAKPPSPMHAVAEVKDPSNAEVNDVPSTNAAIETPASANAVETLPTSPSVFRVEVQSPALSAPAAPAPAKVRTVTAKALTKPTEGAAETSSKAEEPTSPTQRELMLLSDAKQKLESGQASSALAIVRAGAFSVLEQEAAAVRIEALARTGQVAEAKREYERFQSRFPGSPHTARLERWVSAAK